MAYLSREEVLRPLTPRERDVVERIARGLEGKEIARDLNIAIQTVKAHIKSVKNKLYARNQLEVAILFYGGRPQAMPDAHEHPLRLTAEIEMMPTWQSHTVYRLRRA